MKYLFSDSIDKKIMELFSIEEKIIQLSEKEKDMNFNTENQSLMLERNIEHIACQKFMKII